MKNEWQSASRRTSSQWCTVLDNGLDDRKQAAIRPAAGLSPAPLRSPGASERTKWSGCVQLGQETDLVPGLRILSGIRTKIKVERYRAKEAAN